MKLFKKVYWLIYPILIVVFMLILDKVFQLKEIVIQTSIAVVLAFFLSPKVKTVQKQSGEEDQIKWLFFNKVINKKNNETI
jgi:branched-subunit amino acid permease